MTVIDRDLGMSRIVRDLQGLDDAEVFVGVRQEKGAQEDPESGVTLADYATWNEFGTADGHVPERSFLRSTVDEKEDVLQATLNREVGQVLDGKIDAKTALGRTGARAVGLVQARISAGIDPPNAPSTVAAKGSSKPLIDTGRLRQSIEYEARIGEAEVEHGTAKGAA